MPVTGWLFDRELSEMERELVCECENMKPGYTKHDYWCALICIIYEHYTFEYHCANHFWVCWGESALWPGYDCWRVGAPSGHWDSGFLQASPKTWGGSCWVTGWAHRGILLFLQYSIKMEVCVFFCRIKGRWFVARNITITNILLADQLGISKWQLQKTKCKISKCKTWKQEQCPYELGKVMLG